MSDDKSPAASPKAEAAAAASPEASPKAKKGRRGDVVIRAAKGKSRPNLRDDCELIKRVLGNPEKPDELEITGTSECMPAVIRTTETLKEQGCVEVTKIETGIGAGASKSLGRVSVWVKKTPDFDSIIRREQEQRLQDVVASVKNSAFVFIKPHANNAEVQKLVSEFLEGKKIKILKQGTMQGTRIDEQNKIDKHYYSIAAKATLNKPDTLNVPADKFQEKFGIGWEEALAKGNVYNAKDAAEKLQLSADELEQEWRKTEGKGKMIKFGGGFYCAYMELEGKEPMYVFNGFFMSMRARYCGKENSIAWFSVQWDPKELSWEDFRGKVLGPTNPKEAPADSLRGIILAKWEELGLKSEPNKGDNGVHASASPFEGLAERMNWLDARRDPFSRALRTAGVPTGLVEEWSKDPQVKVDGEKKGSLFDALEDLDAGACITRCVELAKLNPHVPKPRAPKKEKEAEKEAAKEAAKEAPAAEAAPADEK
eukprot:TRINITY_DN294_c0_g1_i2.p2 TRINITY_DN294_c0_g1~~TRINITY_DN294_c0_g1_i2.p2  ORF type:complete len:483 (+),score=202.48 TRINITY_DN294_c0_g1_i2:76-1524(+)